MDSFKNEKYKIKSAYDSLKEINIDGFTFYSINKDGIVILSKDNQKKEMNVNNLMMNKDVHKNSSKYTETSEMDELTDTKLSKYSETSDVGQIGGMASKYSETSEMNQLDEILSKYSETSDMSEIPTKMVGGSKNIFRKMNYSETSNIKMSNMSNYSMTSSEIFNERSDNYSETSIIGQIGGDNNETTDTLMGISELKQRKSYKSTNLDMGIFKKTQSGGSVDQNIRKKMMDIGINSNSSTSSICE